MLSLGSLTLNLKIRFPHWLLIALFATAVNVGLEEWLGQSLIKVVVPVFVIIGLFSYLLKINLHKSAIAIIMGCSIYAFIESITMLFLYNLFKMLPEEIFYGVLVNIIAVLFMVILGLGIFILIKKFNWQLYNLAQVADDSRENEPILTGLLFFIGIPFLIYCFILYLMFYLADFPEVNIVLILSISNVIFLLYFFAACFAMKRFDHALAKTYKYRADRSVMGLLRHFFETRFGAKEVYVKQITPADSIPIPQLNLFFQIQYALAKERQWISFCRLLICPVWKHMLTTLSSGCWKGCTKTLLRPSGRLNSKKSTARSSRMTMAGLR